jgi:hypothetical protein
VRPGTDYARGVRLALIRIPSVVIPVVVISLGIALPARGIAGPKPKIAVAPLDGDPGNKIATAVVDALAGKDYAVVGPKETGREIGRLNLTGELDAKATRKLTTKLGVVAVIDGKVSKAGGKRFLHLEVHRRGKSDAGFTIEFKATTSKGFRRGIHDEIDRKLEGASDDPAGDDEARPAPFADDDRKHKSAEPAPADDERPARTASDDGEPRRKAAPADDEAERRPRKPAADDEEAGRRPRKAEARPARRSAASADDDTASVRKRKRARAADDDQAAPLAVARVGAGAAVAQRQLTWDLRSGFTQIPPRVKTTAGAGRIDGEIYPLALADPHSGLAALGLAASYDKTFGLAIKVPNQTVSAPINQSHYAIGARYRLALGDTASVAFGLDYAHRQYVADRSTLGAAVLDTPDFEYRAISPGAWLRVPVTSSVAVFGGGDGLLIFETGGVQKSTSYGPATVYGFEATAGVDIALAKQIALRIGLEYSQIMFKFSPKGPTMANNRDGDQTTLDVKGATDRSIGGTVMACLSY